MSEDNGDGNDDEEGSQRADRPKTCAACGREIDVSGWHPVVTRQTDDGFRVYAFCDDDCRDDWDDGDS